MLQLDPGNTTKTSRFPRNKWPESSFVVYCYAFTISQISEHDFDLVALPLGALAI